MHSNILPFQINQFSKLYALRELPETFMNDVYENLTIVTAYWNLGSFRKGKDQQHTKQHYEQWASVFESMVNPLIVYTDSRHFQTLMESYRSKLQNKTSIFFVNRTRFWPFHLTEKIRAVFNQPGYPQFYPNTFIPEYSASQHMKFAVMADAVKRNLFGTLFYSWLDVGYFRDIVYDKRYFRLNPPPGIDKDRLCINEVSPKLNITASVIFKENVVWVGGGMLVGTKEIFLKFEILYKKSVNYFLAQNLMNSDQQIIYSLYTEEGRRVFDPDVELQIYKFEKTKSSTKNKWFFLGYLCREVLIY